jgi:glycosyltransferase involved in cell wall biosynthesis
MELTSPKGRPLVSVVIPVLNEAHVLANSVATVRSFLHDVEDFRFRVVIVDNGSTDGTAVVARGLSARFPEVDYLHLEEKGRGRALRHAWQAFDSDIACYTDVDLSTELNALPRLLYAIHQDGYDLAIGSRLMRESVTIRSVGREIISRGYNLILKAILQNSFSDAQCGFKAVSREVVDALVPQVRDESWFFDTELLVLAERSGYRIKDIPVVWTEDDDSRVNVIRTGWDDLKGIFRLRRHFWKKRLRRQGDCVRQSGIAVEADRSEATGG